MNDTRPTIYERMIAILGDLPAIGKNQRNEQQRFMFRGHDDVLNALNPLLSKHGVFVVPNVLERITDQRQTRSGNTMFEVNLRVEFTFYGERGDSVSCSTWGEGTDSGDKATNKAMTMAFKNALNQSFSISTEETKDTDAETPPASTGRTSAQTTGEVAGSTPGPEPSRDTAVPSEAPSPVGSTPSQEDRQKAWIAAWDSHGLKDLKTAIASMAREQVAAGFIMESERANRGKDVRKTVQSALRDRINVLDALDGVDQDLGGGPKGDAGEASVSQATTEGATESPSDSEPAPPPKELLLVKAALAWIADQPESVGDAEEAKKWTKAGIVLGLRKRADAGETFHAGEYNEIEEVPVETLQWIFDTAIPGPVTNAVLRLGPEQLAALAGQAK